MFHIQDWFITDFLNIWIIALTWVDFAGQSGSLKIWQTVSAFLAASPSSSSAPYSQSSRTFWHIWAIDCKKNKQKTQLWLLTASSSSSFSPGRTFWHLSPIDYLLSLTQKKTLPTKFSKMERTPCACRRRSSVSFVWENSSIIAHWTNWPCTFCRIFIRPESDHWQPLSLTDSYSDCRLVNLIDVTLVWRCQFKTCYFCC